ncbi:putative protein N(5)-glutamine methyltransferase [Desertivibrio insolitus]|uniref:putative protein N(5)-glutamine methyltransferase n=1 Tax=Herbiconiux sp. SYSU D00978 TaxID=2812562 RepID=UPI001A95F213|nr:putative protein N(5)-glutamine methyltransferase [Herbiconiux sp. SYSU D00978]
MPTPLSPSHLDALVARLRAAGCVFAEEEADVLAASARDADELEALAARRVSGEPLEHVVGWAEFCGLRLEVDPGVFVPRRRTEQLARAAALMTRPGAIVVDLCCGSGAVGAAMRSLVPGLVLHAADVDAAAVACARRNLPGAEVHEGDLFDALPATLTRRVDTLVANVPYVPSDAIATLPPEAREHEPHATLDGGPDGLDLLRRVATGAPRWLADGGSVLMEVSEHQADDAVAAVVAAGLDARAIRSADEDDDTVVVLATFTR